MANYFCITVQWIERKKKSVTCMDIFAIHKEDKSKAICLICNEKVSQGGNNPKHFNMTNFCKHLQSHSSEYKKICEVKPLSKRKLQQPIHRQTCNHD